MKINYNEICKIYDDVREGDIITINGFLEEINLDENSTVLDIGCGTGNYTGLFQSITKAKFYGLEASQGMLSRAMEKNREITFVQGDAQDMPFEADKFDFIYMTDVIHHIPDLNKLFSEILRVLKKGGKACIATQSYKQIEERVTSVFFPETSDADKKRYPDIDKIIEKAEIQKLTFLKAKEFEEGIDSVIDNKFLELAEKKGYSMFHLISEEGYLEGLKKLREALQNGPFTKKSAGGTLVWFQK